MKPLEWNNALLRAAGTGDMVEVERLVEGGGAQFWREGFRMKMLADSWYERWKLC